MKYVGMKYLICPYESKAFLSDDVKYMDNNWYLVSRWQKKKEYRCVRGCDIVKMTDERFEDFILSLHHQIYRSYDGPAELEYETVDGNIATFSIYFGGMVNGIIYHCPKNILRAKYVTAIEQGPFAYSFVPCDKNGVPYSKKNKYQINASSYTCNIVYDVIKCNPGISTPELIELIGWNDRQVTPRISELLAGGRIKVVGKVVNPESGRLVSQWEII